MMKPANNEGTQVMTVKLKDVWSLGSVKQTYATYTNKFTLAGNLLFWKPEK